MSQPGQIPATQNTDGIYKSQLQEFCQRRSWPLPEYKTLKEGTPHAPSFKATVLVNQLSFETPNSFKRAKDAQIEAAKLALAHFTSAAPATEIKTAPPKCTSVKGESSSTCSNANKRPMNEEISTPTVEKQVPTPEKASDNKRSKHSKGELQMYKNQLQSFVLKNGYNLPTYTFEREGPPHSSRFKSKVNVNGQVYESPGFFSTLKESEHAAAKVALSSLVPPESQDTILDKSVFKNLLQDLAQKSGLNLPIYNTTSIGATHMPTFVSTVVVGGETFRGEEAKTKKHAEMNAAEVAYSCLSQREIQGPDDSSPVGITQAVSNSNKLALHASDMGAANQLGLPSPFSTQTAIGPPKSCDQEAPKQVPFCDAIHSNGSLNVVITTNSSSIPHPNPSEHLEYITLPDDECSSPLISHGSVSIPIPDIFSGSSSSTRDVVRVYPRSLNMDFPAGAVVQYCDDKWIAIKIPAKQMGQ